MPHLTYLCGVNHSVVSYSFLFLNISILYPLFNLLSRKILIYFLKGGLDRQFNSKCCYHRIGLLSLPDVQPQRVRRFCVAFPLSMSVVLLVAFHSRFRFLFLSKDTYIIPTLRGFVNRNITVFTETLL